MRAFIETKVIVYANEATDPEKRAKALDLGCWLLGSGEGVVSAQVLSEYVAVAKLGQAEASGCQTLLSEDLDPGRHHAQVICKNPFA